MSTTTTTSDNVQNQKSDGPPNHQTHLKMQTEIEEYIATLDDIERFAMEIAKSQLKTSFSIERSNGFVAFQADKRKNKESAKKIGVPIKTLTECHD
jgi:hypothetical protein